MRRVSCRHEPTKTRPLSDSPLNRKLGIVGDHTPDYDGWLVPATCEYGHCVEMLCPVCGRMRMGWGPIECPCEDATPRGMRHSPHPVPVKPSRARRGQRGRHNR